MFWAQPFGRSASSSLGPVDVTLHVYNAGESPVVRGLNFLLKQFDTGVFHCGVEVYGVEWSFADTSSCDDDFEADSITGIFDSMPKQADGHTYCESVSLGQTDLLESEVLRLINLLDRLWSGETYDVLQKNCCHFCVALCKELGVREPPRWIMSLAERAAAIATNVEDLMRSRRIFLSSLVDPCSHSCCCEAGNGAWVEKIDVDDNRGRSRAASRLLVARHHMRHNPQIVTL